MSEPDKPTSTKDFDARLQSARAKRDAAKKPREGLAGSGLGMAMRVAVELVAALMVGVAIGWALDSWLGTKPWMLILFFLLGSAAGIMNVFRAVGGFEYGAGYRKDEDQAPSEGQGDKPDGD